MSAVSELKVYRPPLLCLALGWVVFAAFFVVGMSMVTIGPSHRGGASAAVVGALVLLLSLGSGRLWRLTGSSSLRLAWCTASGCVEGL